MFKQAWLLADSAIGKVQEIDGNRYRFRVYPPEIFIDEDRPPDGELDEETNDDEIDDR